MQTQKRFNWKRAIFANIVKLRFTGLWPPSDKGYTRDSKYTLYTMVCYSCFTFGHNFFQAVNMFLVITDLDALTSTLFVNLSELLGLLKSYCLIKEMKLLKQLLITLQSDMFQPKDESQRKLVKPNLTNYSIIYIIYWLFSGGAIFFWATFPLLDRTTKEYRLPFMAWFPFDTKKSPNYQITYVYQVVGILFVSTSTVAVDTLIAALNMYVCGQLDILCDDLKHLRAETFHEDLLICIRHHKAILKFKEETNNFFNWIVFFQFFISATSIGITLFRMTIVIPFSSEFYSLLLFEIAIVAEIFMYCWFGNEVEEKSKNIATSIFESDWINASPKSKKTMIIFVMYCQQPLKVSALNLFYLEIQTFLKIMQASWSYFTLLQNMGFKH